MSKGLADSWHSDSIDDVLDRLDATAGGLSQAQAAARLASYGPNCIPGPLKRSAVLRFLQHFHNILIYVLLASAVITATLGHITDTVVILAVVIANAAIGFFQEGKAERAMEAIRQMLALRVSVLRDGDRLSIDSDQLVPGDVVLLEAGDKVPADLRLIETRGVRVQESILTGESVPVEKSTNAVAVDTQLGDRASMAYGGTLVTSGFGRGVIVATGSNTEIGRISGMLSDVAVLTTPLVLQMNVFSRWLTILILLIAATLLVFGYFVEHFVFADMFMAVVGLSVAAIPEGLPAVLTITLAVGVQAMARRNVIVRRLPAIETLGAVSVICTDKTGTLTRNEMMVGSVAVGEHRFEVNGIGYEPNGAIKLDQTVIDLKDHAMLSELGRSALLCNDASIQEHDGVWTVEGDPMEGALLAFASKTGADTRHDMTAWKRIDAIPFDAEHRFMATLNHNHEHQAVISIKGAPEQILSMCSLQRAPDGGTQPLEPETWSLQAESLASLGERVLAFAVKPVALEQTVLEFKDVEEDLVFLGLVGLIDPPRPEAIEAIAECLSAGIRVKMITGDHKGTAVAIGRQVGLVSPDKLLTGTELDAMDDATLALAVMETDVFARTTPGHKLRLVTALQSHGMTVAMTGDGVNDAPALKRADAGIAMGKSGSEAAKEAAEFILVDDNFASILAAVREGRTVYDNIKKVICWTLPTNAGEALTIVVALLFGMTLPITPAQILWVNLITAITLGIALAFEPTEANTMKRAPRARDEPLLNSELGWRIVFVSILFLSAVFGIYVYAIEQGNTIEMARTMALNTLVVMEIFHLFFIRNIYGTSLTWQAVRGTRVVWLTVTSVVLAQFAITYLPPLQAVFQTQSVSLANGILIIAIGVVSFAILETEKQLRLAIIGRAG
ncbi:MAG: cation-transporting P-type ATPase [Pseudomonadales bacterium]